MRRVTVATGMRWGDGLVLAAAAPEPDTALGAETFVAGDVGASSPQRTSVETPLGGVGGVGIERTRLIPEARARIRGEGARDPALVGDPP